MEKYLNESFLITIEEISEWLFGVIFHEIRAGVPKGTLGRITQGIIGEIPEGTLVEILKGLRWGIA